MKTLIMMILAVSTMAMAEQSNSNVSAGASAKQPELWYGAMCIVKPTIIFAQSSKKIRLRNWRLK